MTTFPDIQDGYRGLANFIGPHLDTGMGVFKRFSKLNTLNLLSMQAELTLFEQDLKAISYLDENCVDAGRVKFARSVAELKSQPHNPQWNLILEAREKLKEYNQALREQAKLARLSKAREYDREIVQHWILNQEGGKGFLQGAEAQPWLPSHLDDLVAISNRATNDTFTRWVEEKVVPWLYWIFLHPWKVLLGTRIVSYGASSFTRMARIITVCFSTLLPSIAVLSLYYIDELTARLGAIIAFSATFSLVLAVFTNARPIEIFTATAS
ncbi:hypothetical protein EK21DRAFT_80361 [Setomelanomma holmii]|uniref:DUF6594 domain-containing protein n=1 Tax=Setomelanomma holmii TaxID=210430 RepID=A0A9P4GY85_9PLEO|nr:hypothetical protein EK21DRAFT_80361 [Setomelanomma holmii]